MTAVNEMEALMPKPVYIDPINDGGTRFIVKPLAIKQLLVVVRYVEDSKEVLSGLGKLKEGESFLLSRILEGEAGKRVNGLIRLLIPGQADKLTDEYCEENFSAAHYKAIVMASLKQNALYEVFTKAGTFIEKFMENQVAGAPAE